MIDPAGRARSALALVAVLTALFGVANGEENGNATQALTAQLSQRETAFHILNRLAFGPRPGEVEQVLKDGWMAWVLAQLDPDSIDDSELEARLAAEYPSLAMNAGKLLREYTTSYRGEGTVAEQRESNRLRYEVMQELREATLLSAVESKRQFREVMVEFWRNHFSIDQNKDACNYITQAYEAEVMRKHVFGKFEDMLMASAKHPAMLVYLDNYLSQKPLSDREKETLERAKGKNRAGNAYLAALERERGLNENYARELMELHTLGVIHENVSGGYTQEDVIEVARALTGWSVSAGQMDYGFAFSADVHDKNPKNVQVVRLKTGARGGVEEGETIIKRLARHPGTAKFIAFKLCRYLVNDHPPEKLVEDIAKVFDETEGDLKAVYQAIIFHPEFFRRENFRVKFKTPFEFTASALRATGSKLVRIGPCLTMLGRMGQPVYQCVDPTGYYDQAEAWLDPGVLVYRWQFALDLAAGRVDGIELRKDFYQPLLKEEPREIETKLREAILPGGVDPATQRILDDVIARVSDRRELARRLLGMLLGSPTFMQQ